MAEKLERYEEQNIEEMTAEKAKLDTLMSTIADGAILLDTNFQLLLINPAARQIFGWEDTEIIGQNVLHLFPSELTVKLTKPLYQIAAGETLQPEESASHSDKNIDINNEEHHNYSPAEFRLSLNNPKPCTIRLLLTQVFDQYRENVRGIAMTVQDITREAELNEAKSQFISNVSHELRTPLFNIKSFIETLTEFGEDLSDTEKREILETANHETDRLTRLVNDVLDLSRLESSRNYNLDAIDIGQLIEQTLRTYQLNARDKGLELCSDIEASLMPVLGHYDLLLQVLTNLVGNALKFTTAGGKVVIRAYKITKNHPQETVKIRVEIADTGIGIDAEDQSAIFDRFYRVENRVHTLEGTGLGLSIVKNIIEKHYSQINLISEVGIGTTFWFDLDMYQESIASKKISDVSL
jgi:two-component system sensor histidine kinase NblS